MKMEIAAVVNISNISNGSVTIDSVEFVNISNISNKTMKMEIPAVVNISNISNKTITVTEIDSIIEVIKLNTSNISNHTVNLTSVQEVITTTTTTTTTSTTTTTTTTSTTTTNATTTSTIMEVTTTSTTTSTTGTTTTTQPVTPTVVSCSFRVQGLSYQQLNTNFALRTACSSKMRKAVVRELEVPEEWVRIRFKQGSVVIVVEIEIPAEIDPFEYTDSTNSDDNSSPEVQSGDSSQSQDDLSASHKAYASFLEEQILASSTSSTTSGTTSDSSSSSEGINLLGDALVQDLLTVDDIAQAMERDPETGEVIGVELDANWVVEVEKEGSNLVVTIEEQSIQNSSTSTTTTTSSSTVGISGGFVTKKNETIQTYAPDWTKNQSNTESSSTGLLIVAVVMSSLVAVLSLYVVYLKVFSRVKVAPTDEVESDTEGNIVNRTRSSTKTGSGSQATDNIVVKKQKTLSRVTTSTTVIHSESENFQVDHSDDANNLEAADNWYYDQDANQWYHWSDEEQTWLLYYDYNSEDYESHDHSGPAAETNMDQEHSGDQEYYGESASQQQQNQNQNQSTSSNFPIPNVSVISVTNDVKRTLTGTIVPRGPQGQPSRMLASILEEVSGHGPPSLHEPPISKSGNNTPRFDNDNDDDDHHDIKSKNYKYSKGVAPEEEISSEKVTTKKKKSKESHKKADGDKKKSKKDKKTDKKKSKKKKRSKIDPFSDFTSSLSPEPPESRSRSRQHRSPRGPPVAAIASQDIIASFMQKIQSITRDLGEMLKTSTSQSDLNDADASECNDLMNKFDHQTSENSEREILNFLDRIQSINKELSEVNTNSILESGSPNFRRIETITKTLDAEGFTNSTKFKSIGKVVKTLSSIRSGPDGGGSSSLSSLEIQNFLDRIQSIKKELEINTSFLMQSTTVTNSKSGGPPAPPGPPPPPPPRSKSPKSIKTKTSDTHASKSISSPSSASRALVLDEIRSMEQLTTKTPSRGEGVRPGPPPPPPPPARRVDSSGIRSSNLGSKSTTSTSSKMLNDFLNDGDNDEVCSYSTSQNLLSRSRRSGKPPPPPPVVTKSRNMGGVRSGLVSSPKNLTVPGSSTVTSSVTNAAAAKSRSLSGFSQSPPAGPGSAPPKPPPPPPPPPPMISERKSTSKKKKSKKKKEDSD